MNSKHQQKPSLIPSRTKKVASVQTVLFDKKSNIIFHQKKAFLLKRPVAVLILSLLRKKWTQEKKRNQNYFVFAPRVKNSNLHKRRHCTEVRNFGGGASRQIFL